ncbi:hypothetical protein ABBQ38_001701 [Trebouxia sp. C0009 RCD-2024]
MTAPTQRPPLRQLLSKAVKAPDRIQTQDGGAVLALSIHCLFAQAGFTTVQATASDYAPQPDWNSSHEAWAFQYKKKGYVNRFTYECGLRQSTGQAYVHVTEEGNSGNISFMGLILHKYIPDVAKLRQNNWEGVVVNETDLTTYFDNYILTPVLSKALLLSNNERDAGSSSRTKVTVAAGVASLLCVLVWGIKRKQQS